MHVLVTGAGGFIGGHIARDLAGRGFTVTATYRHTRPILSGVPSAQMDLVQTDLMDPQGLPTRLDAVVHAAATSAWAGIGVDDMVRDNVLATRMLLDHALAAGATRFVLTSTMSVFGRIASPIVDETTPIINPDAYGISKRLCELMLEEKAGRLPALALRLPGVIGRGARRNFLASTLAKLRRNEPIDAFNPDGLFNNAVHVAELSALVARVLERGWTGFDRLVLAARGETTVRNVIERMAIACGSSSSVTFHPSDRIAFVLSCDRAIESYNYAPGRIENILDRYVAEEMRQFGGDFKN